MKHISERTRNDIISLLNENLSLRKIAPKVGVSIVTVNKFYNILERQNITKRVIDQESYHSKIDECQCT